MELIEREAAKAKKAYCEERREYVVPVAELDWLPAIDAAPVVHGKWKRRKDGTPYCSACGANERDFYDAVIEECRFCYRCGARMDGGDGYEAG